MTKKLSLILSIIIPAYNEEESISKTVIGFNNTLRENRIKHEILIVNDHSTDNTVKVLDTLKKKVKELRYINNDGAPGFGSAIAEGLSHFKGDYVTIVMADFSDDPKDLVRYFEKIKQGYDCVFGSRFISGGKALGYPYPKLILNRLCNNFVRFVFWIKYNDVTNPFKLYKKETIAGLEPFISKHFNISVEISLKAIVRGYSYTVVPSIWRNRTEGIAKFKIKEVGSRYFLIILYCLIEKILLKNNCKRPFLHSSPKHLEKQD
jgi:dolichol-phosphate mannosyltransferase|tara:strand:+ start:1082 stop:1870 length:789 start_codon:yes stop_codon:yes gene_type:complete